MISVLILSLNEERNLPQCLDAVSWSDDIVVFDSFSSDRTLEIARAAGARIYQRQFDNERDHRTASLNVPFKHRWVFNPDADEITPAELRNEMLKTIGSEPAEVAFRMRFKTFFMGRWIRHSSLYPTWIVRLFQPNRVRFDRVINLRYLIDGGVGRLQNHLLHHTFNNGLTAWIDKHNRYSSAEAHEMIASMERSFEVSSLFSTSDVERRRALKELSFRIPCRATLRFFYMYFLRRGFLDGAPGYHYCRLLSEYEHLITLKAWELKQQRSQFG